MITQSSSEARALRGSCWHASQARAGTPGFGEGVRGFLSTGVVTSGSGRPWPEMQLLRAVAVVQILAPSLSVVLHCGSRLGRDGLGTPLIEPSTKSILPCEGAGSEGSPGETAPAAYWQIVQDQIIRPVFRRLTSHEYIQKDLFPLDRFDIIGFGELAIQHSASSLAEIKSLLDLLACPDGTLRYNSCADLF